MVKGEVGKGRGGKEWKENGERRERKGRGEVRNGGKGDERWGREGKGRGEKWRRE